MVKVTKLSTFPQRSSQQQGFIGFDSKNCGSSDCNWLWAVKIRESWDAGPLYFAEKRVQYGSSRNLKKGG
jgi:hypothetical protein